MATPDVYVDSTASGLNDGTSWTNAWTSLSSAATNAANGDLVGISKNHSEALTAISWTNGTAASPIICMSLDPADDSYVSRNQNGDTDGASITSASTFKHAGNVQYWGIHFDISTDLTFVDDSATHVEYHDCLIEAGDDIRYSGVVAAMLIVKDSTVSFNNRGFHTNGEQTITKFINCNIIHTAAPGTLIDSSSVVEFGCRMEFRNCDLTDFGTIVGGDQENVEVKLVECQMRSGYDLHGGTPSRGTEVSLERSSATTNLTAPVLGLTEKASFWGVTKATTSKYRTGGADDGEQANAYSYEMASNANCREIFSALKSPWVTRWVNGGSAITCTIYIGSENVTFQDDELWIELVSPDETATSTTLADFRYSRLGESGTTPVNGQLLGTPQDTPANITADGSSTWNGFTTASAQKVSFTFTPDIAGPVKMRACLAKPSATVYIDPLIEVT